MKYTKYFVMLALLLTTPAVFAGDPPLLFNKPVKVDESGRPLYNSFERYEYQRKQRVINRNKAGIPIKTSGTSTSHPGMPIPHNGSHVNSADSTVPTPSSVIINRPIQIKGDPTTDDLGL